MSDPRWSLVFELFDAARKRPAAERARFLEQACGGDEDLRQEVERLLRTHDETQGVLDRSEDLDSLVSDDGEEQLVGTLVGPYTIETVIGEGGMGVVCAARQTAPLERRVALKLIKVGMDTAEVVRRFASERQALALMDHANIARVHDAGATDDGRPYFVMELIDGMAITDYCDRHRLSVAERLELFLPVCAAVQHAHQKGILHRDLKPSNVLVARADGRPLPKVIDFGIAKATDPRLSPGTQLTRQGLPIGTPEYMSPEQADSGLDVDTRSDVYSLGVLLYRLLTGVLPFTGELREAVGFDEIRRLHTEQEPPTPSARLARLGEEAGTVAEQRRSEPERLRRRLSGELDWIVLKAIERERDRRYGSPAELAADLERHLAHQPVLAGPPGRAYRLRKFVRRHRLGVTAASLLLLLAAGSGVTITVQSLRLAAALRTAEAERRTAESVSDFLLGLFDDTSPARGGQVMSVRELVDRGAERLTSELSEETEVRARLLGALGKVYRDLAAYDRSESLLQESLGILRHGPDSRALCQTLLRLGVLYRETSELERSAEVLREALELCGRIGYDELETEIHIQLGAVRRLQGEWEEAERWHREALARTTRPDSAIPELEAAALEGLAILLHDRGRFEEAISLYRQVLETRREMGEQLAILPLQNLAAVLIDRGNHEEAEPLLREALALSRKHLGNAHPRVAMVLNNLALLLHRTGDYDAAEPLYREALAIHRSMQEAPSGSLVVDLNNLGLLHLERGELPAAIPYFREAMEVQEQVAPGHSDLGFPLNNLARTLHGLGRLDEAEATYRRALELRQTRLPAGHPQVAPSLMGLGKLLHDRGSPGEAEPLLREALEIRRAKLTAGDWRTAENESLLGTCLAALGRFEEAEPLVLSGWRGLRDARGAGASESRLALARLAELYEGWGRKEEAARYRVLARPE